MKNDFGKYLKQLRVDRGFTLRDVEKKAKISNAYLSQIERGLREVPHFSLLSKLAECYGVTVNNLLEKADPNRKKETYIFKVPPADTAFICSSYERLSDEKKEQLKNYMTFLLKQVEELKTKASK